VTTPRPVLDVRLGDRVTLARPHPCGTRGWQVVRVGADIGLRCEGCARRVLLTRADLERRLRGPIVRASST
jgi:hypothetical protein